MSTHTLPWTFEELGKGKNKSLEVEFECHVSPGSPGSYWDPPEPPEIEFAEVTIIGFNNGDGEIAVSPDLLPTLKEVAFILAERDRDSLLDALSERIGDYEEAAMDDYYDRKRDERRGC